MKAAVWVGEVVGVQWEGAAVCRTDAQRLPGNTICQIVPFDDVAAIVSHRTDKSADELFMKCI